MVVADVSADGRIEVVDRVKEMVRPGGGPYLLVDVGGGRVGLTLVEDGKPLWMRSVPLGVARLTERFFPKDPPTGRQLRAFERHVARTVGDLLDRARRRGVVAAIGT